MSVVYFDFETTNLHTKSEIVGLGAVDDQGDEFHRYIIPRCPINLASSKRNGITKNGEAIFYKGVKIEDAVEPETGLEQFLNWLEGKNCKYLVAHNNSKFDKHIFKNNLKRFDFEVPEDLQYVDSIDFVKKNFPDLRSRTLGRCLEYFLGEDQNETHNALDDAKDCKRICDAGAIRLDYDNFENYLENNK